VWLPNDVTNSADIDSLSMANPASANSVYAKDGDIIDTAYARYNIYNSFITQMNTLKSNGTIVDWKPMAYDWRLDYADLVNYGNQTSDGKIYYRGINAATTTPLHHSNTQSTSE
jgi:hypothetical protein